MLPDEKHQAFVMSLIYEDVKAGRPIEPDKFEAVSDYLRRQGAEVMILGCTELSMIKRDYDIGAGYLDAMEILARKAVLLSGAALKGEYQCLITGYQEKNGKEEENVS